MKSQSLGKKLTRVELKDINGGKAALGICFDWGKKCISNFDCWRGSCTCSIFGKCADL